ncbi:hypothetical protein L1049_004419 [Liquidambar formosana]|uniref:C2H2-type domain-containing protein n=1 Tax=Liquidambar formosana TaxID=63359 RepID=A0AAP0WY98_LIQFO
MEESNSCNMVEKSKKNGRKMTLRDLETLGQIAPPVDPINKQMPERCKCSTCNKSFPTHQALGGHRSSHSKVKKRRHTMDDESAYASAAEDEEHHANYPTALVDETEECEEAAASSRVVVRTGHQCRICNKNFPTGQALGGHKRCHWTSPVEATSSQVASSMGEASGTGRTIKSFDLNEIPALEVEESIDSAFIQPLHAAGYASSSYNSVI